MKLITKILLFLLLTYASTYHKAMKTFIQRCTSKSNEKYGNVTCICRPINRTSKLLSIDIYFHKNVSIEAPIYLELNAYKKFTTVYRPFMIKVKQELCSQLSGKDDIFFQLIVKLTIPPTDNFLNPCPLSGHRFLSPRPSNDETFLLPLIPIGEWIFEFILRKVYANESEDFIGSVSLFYEIKPSGAYEF